MAPAHKLFLSYRRGDTAGHVGRLYDELVRHFGATRVFMDIDGIAPGEDFAQVLSHQLDQAAVVLVVMGQRWVGPKEDGSRRIDDPGDFVRLEVAQALARSGTKIIPVMCDGAQMPAESMLPTAVAAVTRRNAVVLTDIRWKSDVQLLIGAIEPHLPYREGASRGLPRRVLVGAALLVLLFVWRPWSGGTTDFGGGAVAVPSGSVPKALDKTLPERVMRDTRRQLDQVKGDWANDAVLSYVGVDCQSVWTGCHTTLLFQSSEKGTALYASRMENDGDWTYQPTPYSAKWGRVNLDAIELKDALAVARRAGLVGPVSQARLDGPRGNASAASGQWVLEPVDRDGSGRVRFCVDASTKQLNDC